ncbi:DNA-binding transcriptional LysR family regulator [Sphingobium sp. B11D3B]|uniref:LysR family transcriptional regulator n=1 Tax=Sphingobium sp. B11D3B TaxID=2940575 RepID=UPI00222614D3|nr:LysR family transcriptional regulator [Sphingobium sp. B11D3B]MCW2389196.1 DNA-binding transcriptional LysR family regulator [Sphingobium sp. B11D3B]
MRFKGLDLNLLYALSVLLDERSVSRAAARVNISQPAMSAALTRLREHFADDLLVQVGRRMVPTAYAESLQPLVSQLIEQADQILSTSSTFDPAISNRRFRISVSDYMMTVLIGPLMRSLGTIAPGIRIDVYPTGPDATSFLEKGEVDLVICPEQYLSPAHPSEMLLEDEHVVIGWAGNPALAGPLDRETLFSLGHVAVRFGQSRESTFAEQQVFPQQDKQRTELTTNSFSSVPSLIVGTMRVSFLQKRLADAFIDQLPIVVRPDPVGLPPLREMVQHHTARSNDAGILWLVRQMHHILHTE